MNRRVFFKFLGIGATAAVIAPKALACMHNKTQELIVTRQDSSIIKHYLLCNKCDATVEQWDTPDEIKGIVPIAKGIAERIKTNNPEVSERIGRKISEHFKTNN
jgi:hypothetical protein